MTRWSDGVKSFRNGFHCKDFVFCSEGLGASGGLDWKGSQLWRMEVGGWAWEGGLVEPTHGRLKFRQGWAQTCEEGASSGVSGVHTLGVDLGPGVLDFLSSWTRACGEGGPSRGRSGPGSVLWCC